MYAPLKSPTATKTEAQTSKASAAVRVRKCDSPRLNGCSCEQTEALASALRDAKPIVSKAIAAVKDLTMPPRVTKAFNYLFGEVTRAKQEAVGAALEATQGELNVFTKRPLHCKPDDGNGTIAQRIVTQPPGGKPPTVHYEFFPNFFSGKTERRASAEDDVSYRQDAQRAQRIRIVIHEASHAVLGKKKEFYADTGMMPVLPFVQPPQQGQGKATQNPDSVAFFALVASRTYSLDGVLSRIGGLMYEDRVDSTLDSKEASLLAVAATARWVARAGIWKLQGDDPLEPINPSKFAALATMSKNDAELSVTSMLEAAESLFVHHHLVIGKAVRGLKPEEHLRGSHAFGPIQSQAADAQRSLAITVDSAFIKSLQAPPMAAATIVDLAHQLITRVLVQHGRVFLHPGLRDPGTSMKPTDAKVLSEYIRSNARGHTL